MRYANESEMSIGISGAHGVGKTTVGDEVKRQWRGGRNVLMAVDTARSLAKQGIRINMASGTDDYLAFLTVRLRDMLRLHADLVIFERTLIDVLVFMELNGDARGWLYELTNELIQWQMSKLNLYFYIPIEFKTKADGIRISDSSVNEEIDKITKRMLQKHRPDYIALTGSIAKRVDTVLESLSKLKFSSEES